MNTKKVNRHKSKIAMERVAALLAEARASIGLAAYELIKVCEILEDALGEDKPIKKEKPSLRKNNRGKNE